MKASEIAQQLQATVQGDPDTLIRGFSPPATAKPGDLTFAETKEYFNQACGSEASAILVSEDFGATSKTLIKVANARVGFARVLHLLFPPKKVVPGIHPSAVIAGSAVVDETACVGPLCHIGERTRVGPRCALEAGVMIGEDCELGEDVQIHPNVTLYDWTRLGHRVRIHSGTVIGSDGFGYVVDKGAHLKVPQIGWVTIQDDVEIGANVCIDRGALGATVIGKGTKIDNLVQIAHNVEVGEHCILVGQCGVAGSTKLGHYVTMAGQSGLAGHLNIGNKVIVGGQAGVMHDIPDGEMWLGSPAVPNQQIKREWITLKRLPEMRRKIAELEAKLEALGGS